MNKVTPSLKARAEWIPWTLQCIRDNRGNYHKMQNCILAHWRKVSQRTKPPTEKNSLRAVFGPTLRHLQLIIGDGNNIELMSKGKELLETYERYGETSFKRALAKHLLKLDRERWCGVISKLKILRGPMTEKKFLSHLQITDSDSKVTLDKLRKLLSYYAYVGLVKLESGTVTIRQKQVEMLLKGIDVKLSEKGFFEALHKAYEKLSLACGGPYVSIPDLREEVCEKTGMWPDDFYKMLESIPKETGDYLIHLSQPMLRKPGGIKIGGKYLYYVAIYKK